MQAEEVITALAAVASKEKAASSAWFFKTGPGQYGEGDEFIGVTVPAQRQVARTFRDLPLPEIKKLLTSPIHEHRLSAVFILVNQFAKAKEPERSKIFNFYLKNLDRINNWDIVDSSAAQIVGEYLIARDRKLLVKFARSKNMWHRRVAIISTLAFIRAGESKWTFDITELLMRDPEDLLHKACGWAIREVGKKDRAAQLRFLDKHHQQMPRTMLRYAIEHLDAEQKRKYMQR